MGVPLALSFYTEGDESGSGSRRVTGFTLTFNAGYIEMEQQFYDQYKGFGGSVTLSIGYEAR